MIPLPFKKKYTVLFFLFSIVFFFLFAYLSSLFEPLKKFLDVDYVAENPWFSLQFLISTIGLFVCYGILFFFLTKCRPSSWLLLSLFLFPLLIMLFGMFYYPKGADDLFQYVLTSQTHILYHQNSYTTIPHDIIANRLTELSNIKGISNPYGPLWTIISFIPVLFFPANIFFSLLSTKIIFILFYLASGIVFYLMAEKQHFSQSLRLSFLYLWNPLLLFETSIAGHNDIVMVFFLLLSFFALFSSKKLLSIFFLTLSLLVKYVSLIFLPFFLLYIYLTEKSKRKFFLLSAAVVFIGTLALFFLPFWQGTKIFHGLYQQSIFYHASLPFFLQMIWGNKLGIYKILLTLVFLCLYFFIFVKSVSKKDFKLIKACYNITILYFVFACFYFMPWYAVWLLPLALLLVERKIVLRCIIFTISCMLSYGINWQVLLNKSWYDVQAYNFLWLFVPQIVFLLWDLITFLYERNTESFYKKTFLR